MGISRTRSLTTGIATAVLLACGDVEIAPAPASSGSAASSSSSSSAGAGGGGGELEDAGGAGGRRGTCQPTGEACAYGDAGDAGELWQCPAELVLPPPPGGPPCELEEPGIWCCAFPSDAGDELDAGDADACAPCDDGDPCTYDGPSPTAPCACMHVPIDGCSP